MSHIISISLPEETLQQLDRLTKEQELSGRSETIRQGLRLLQREHKSRTKVSGNIHAILSVIHTHQRDVASLTHDYQPVIVTHLHHHLKEDHCLDVFVLKGDATRIRKLVESLERDKKISNVKFDPIE